MDTGYTWSQTDTEVTIVMPIESSLKGRDIICEINPTSLTLGLFGKDPILKGDLMESVKVDDSTWELETEKGQRVVKVVLVKSLEYRHWDAIMRVRIAKVEGDEDNAVKAMLREWPALADLGPEEKNRMAKIRPALLELTASSPRSELMRLIEEIMSISKNVGEDKKEANSFLLERVMLVQSFFLER